MATWVNTRNDFDRYMTALRMANRLASEEFAAHALADAEVLIDANLGHAASNNFDPIRSRLGAYLRYADGSTGPTVWFGPRTTEPKLRGILTELIQNARPPARRRAYP